MNGAILIASAGDFQMKEANVVRSIKVAESSQTSMKLAAPAIPQHRGEGTR